MFITMQIFKLSKENKYISSIILFKMYLLTAELYHKVVIVNIVIDKMIKSVRLLIEINNNNLVIAMTNLII